MTALISYCDGSNNAWHIFYDKIVFQPKSPGFSPAEIIQEEVPKKPSSTMRDSILLIN